MPGSLDNRKLNWYLLIDVWSWKQCSHHFRLPPLPHTSKTPLSNSERK